MPAPVLDRADGGPHSLHGMINLRLDTTALTAEMAGLAGYVAKPARLSKILGLELRNQLRAHFVDKDKTEPNKLKGDRTHYWRQISKSVTSPTVSSDGMSATVAITEETFAQKLFGGVIRAKRGLYLTIPVSSAAHGKTTRAFEREEGIKLFFIKRPFGGLLATKAPNKESGITVHYILKPSVKQDPTPDALPSEADLQKAMADRARYLVELNPKYA